MFSCIFLKSIKSIHLTLALIRVHIRFCFIRKSANIDEPLIAPFISAVWAACKHSHHGRRTQTTDVLRGFLGAAAPAVKGLKEAQFEADNAGVLFFGDNDFADLPEQHRKMITRHQTSVVIEKLITQGKVLPLHQSGIMDFMDALDDGQSVAFADGTETSKSAWFLEYLEKQPEMVSFGEIDLGDAIPTHTDTTTPSGFSVDPDRHALQIQANKLAEAEGISFTDAVSWIEA